MKVCGNCNNWNFSNSRCYKECLKETAFGFGKNKGMTSFYIDMHNCHTGNFEPFNPNTERLTHEEYENLVPLKRLNRVKELSSLIRDCLDNEENEGYNEILIRWVEERNNLIKEMRGETHEN